MLNILKDFVVHNYAFGQFAILGYFYAIQSHITFKEFYKYS